MKKDMRLVQCIVNGKEVAEYVDVRESLLDMLRNRLGLTSVKKGCEVGECGACTVIIDGETIDSCIYLAVWAEGKNIVSYNMSEWRTWKVLRKTANLPGFRKLLLRKALSSADSAHQALLCLPQCFLSGARSLREMPSASIWQEIFAAVQGMRIL